MDQKIAKALIAFREACPSVRFDKENPHFHSRFASLKGILKTIAPALKDSGLFILQFPESQNIDGRVCVGCRTIVLHESGESIEHSFVLPAAKQDPQHGMALLTYARRGALGAVLGLVIEEDDESGAALGYEDLANAGKQKPRESKSKMMSKAHRDELQGAAADRYSELGEEASSSDIGEMIDVAAKTLGHSSRIELPDSEFDKVMAALSSAKPVPF